MNRHTHKTEQQRHEANQNFQHSYSQSAGAAMDTARMASNGNRVNY